MGLTTWTGNNSAIQLGAQGQSDPRIQEVIDGFMKLANEFGFVPKPGHDVRIDFTKNPAVISIASGAIPESLQSYQWNEFTDRIVLETGCTTHSVDFFPSVSASPPPARDDDDSNRQLFLQ